MKSGEHEIRSVREYIEMEAEGETVQRLEKIASERIAGTRHDVWDVHTDQNRWWVITEPTNLYSQDDFPSMNQALTFHVGLMMRVMYRREPSATDEQRDRMATAWRRWTQAGEALDRADEAEEFQAVGMRCRECLLAMARDMADPAMIPDGEEAPKASDFIHWSEHIANFVAAGGSNGRIRSYLKATAKETWELVSWLTHAANATRVDGEFALHTTEHVLANYSLALVRFERSAPDRCPNCGSYRLASDFRPELNIEPPYITLCEACGWEDLDRVSATGLESEP